MRRVISTFIALLLFSAASAQEATTTTQTVESTPIKQWTANYTTLDVDAPIRLTLIKIDKSESPYIVYDTKGFYTSKFSAETSGSVLKIRERTDLKRESVTEVTVYYHTLAEIKVAKASVICKNTLTSPLLDIIISNDSSFVAEVDVKDLMIEITGKCVVEIKGHTLYQTASVSSAEYNAFDLETISTTVSSSHNAIARVDATQRLEGKTATGGKIFYKSYPEILRSYIPVFGGEISKAK